jgi:DNA polymerase-1
MGDGVEVLGLPEILKRWNIQKPEQVIDVLALMGDSSDNVPGVPSVGEKTAMKLISQFGTVENLLAHVGELNGRVKDNLEQNREQALLSKRLVTIIRDVPCPIDIESLKLQPRDDEKLKELFIEFEFNSIGKRLYGENFRAGRGYQRGGTIEENGATEELDFEGEPQASVAEHTRPAADLKTFTQVPHEYRVASSPEQRAELLRLLTQRNSFCFKTDISGPRPRDARLIGISFSLEPHTGVYVPVAGGGGGPQAILEEFRPIFESPAIEKVGHDLKHELSVLKWQGISVQGKLFDTLIAHSLIEPEMRHALAYLSEAYLGYLPTSKPSAETQSDLNLGGTTVESNSDPVVESTDVAVQLRAALEPLLKQKGQERVFYEIESPLIPVLVDMEYEGIKIDAGALEEFGAHLSRQITELEETICRLAGTRFNVSSPRQLGQILFEVLKICEKPKKTRTGQFATDEQTLAALAPDHEIVQRLLEHRAASKLKSTYADTLPVAIWPRTNRVHTTYNQVMTTTGRLNSQDPNLQNIPIRTEKGQEIRKAFVPRNDDYLLLSADYSQIELRIIAALSHEAGLLEAFNTGVDVHTATAAKVYGVARESVTPEMRRKAKMVNYGIAYGISAFGLAQRLSIPRKEAAEIIDQYFKQFPGIGRYMDETIDFARKHGFVETVTGRRRYIRDIRSSNNTVRSGAERNAINAPIQGSAADMIKLAMINIHRELISRRLKTRMLLQVHDELIFDLHRSEQDEVRSLVGDKMRTAIALAVPIVVEIGVGKSWIEAH